MDFKHVEQKYRPLPFWSWNDKLNVKETVRQVNVMNEAGIGGFFMHARGGLMTEYMSDEWFDNIIAASDEAIKLNMYPYAYDENGWPSGFGGGRVNSLGVEYQQKTLYCETYDENKENKNTVLIKDGMRYYYVINPYYVDVLDKKVIKKFVDEIYLEYKKRTGNKIAGMFTDEPQITREGGFPYSFILEKSFSDRYGYSLEENLDALFFNKELTPKIRIDYWQLITELFSESYFKQIHDFCKEAGYIFTGHLVQEENILVQTPTNGACMPHYEYFDIPGIDWLGRNVADKLLIHQCTSAAAQFGRKQIIGEDFAMCGHNVSHSELKRIYEWQMVRGVNMLCPHLEGYTNKGIRKRDFPPAMYIQQPWWQDAKIFFDSVSRIGKLLAEGEITTDLLLIHPITSAWLLYNGNEKECEDVIMERNNSTLTQIRVIEDKHIPFHFGDETIMKKIAKVENGKLIIGEMSYSTVILPVKPNLLPYTEKLLREFVNQGGRITTVEELEPNPIMPVSRLTYTKRIFDEFDMHYIVNTDNCEIYTEIAVGTHVLDIETGDVYEFGGSHTFEPYESLVLLDYKNESAKKKAKKVQKRLPLNGEWEIKSTDMNCVPLDKCDYYFDGKLIEKNGYVLNILPRINELRRPCELVEEFFFECDSMPKTLYLPNPLSSPRLPSGQVPRVNLSLRAVLPSRAPTRS